MADDMSPRDVIDVSAPAETPEPGSAIPRKELNRITDDLIAAFKSVYDPEIPVDIYELGLIYKVDIDDDRKVDIDMTLTSPNCPAVESLPAEVKEKVNEVEGVKEVNFELVWDPPFSQDLMSDEAKLALGLL